MYQDGIIYNHAEKLYAQRVEDGVVNMKYHGDRLRSLKTMALSDRGKLLYKMLNDNEVMTAVDWCEAEIMQTCRIVIFRDSLENIFGDPRISHLYSLKFTKLILESESNRYLSEDYEEKFEDTMHSMRYASRDYQVNQSLTSIAECARYDAYLERRRADNGEIITAIMPPIETRKLHNMRHGVSLR